MQTDYKVTGMTCGHCVQAVTNELTKLDGVAGVSVDLTVGAVSVTSAGPLDVAKVRGAIEEAGYELVG